MVRQMLCAILILSLTGCGFFQIRRPIIIQGNEITKANASQLRTGMTPEEVIAIMGTPVIVHTFTANRIEYAYTYNNGSKLTSEKHVTCIFNNNRLTHVETSGL